MELNQIKRLYLSNLSQLVVIVQNSLSVCFPQNSVFPGRAAEGTVMQRGNSTLKKTKPLDDTVFSDCRLLRPLVNVLSKVLLLSINTMDSSGRDSSMASINKRNDHSRRKKLLQRERLILRQT